MVAEAPVAEVTDPMSVTVSASRRELGVAWCRGCTGRALGVQPADMARASCAATPPSGAAAALSMDSVGKGRTSTLNLW